MEVGAGYWVKYGLSERRDDWELRGVGARPCVRPRQRLPGGAGSTSPAHRPQTVRIRYAEPHPALSRMGYCRRGTGGLPLGARWGILGLAPGATHQTRHRRVEPRPRNPTSPLPGPQSLFGR